MRSLAFIFLFIGSMFLISCRQSKLPVIKNPEVLHQDCAKLFQQFPAIADSSCPTNLQRFRLLEEISAALKLQYFQSTNVESGSTNIINLIQIIPQNNWPASIDYLKPFVVYCGDFGVYIWIKTNSQPFTDNWVAKGYFVQCDSNFWKTWSTQKPVNYDSFALTDLSGIYQVTIPAEAE
jgi:hypothetical protein